MGVVRSANGGKGELQAKANGFDWQTGTQVFGQLIKDAFKKG
jgi:hypothetical protein